MEPPEEQCSPNSPEASIVSASSDMTVSNAAADPTVLEHSEEEQERVLGEGELQDSAAEVREGATGENGEGRDVEASQQQEQEWEDILGNGQLLKKVNRDILYQPYSADRFLVTRGLGLGLLCYNYIWIYIPPQQKPPPVHV